MSEDPLDAEWNEEYQRQFVELYVRVGQAYRLRTDLDPPAALRAKAQNMEDFLVVVFNPMLKEALEAEIDFLRELADIIDLPKLERLDNE